MVVKNSRVQRPMNGTGFHREGKTSSPTSVPFRDEKNGIEGIIQRKGWDHFIFRVKQQDNTGSIIINATGRFTRRALREELRQAQGKDVLHIMVDDKMTVEIGARSLRKLLRR